MATPQLSPGVRIREVDLTVGRADNVNPSIGGIAGPFEKGPVESQEESKKSKISSMSSVAHTMPITTLSIGCLLPHIFHMEQL